MSDSRFQSLRRLHLRKIYSELLFPDEEMRIQCNEIVIIYSRDETVTRGALCHELDDLIKSNNNTKEAGDFIFFTPRSRKLPYSNFIAEDNYKDLPENCIVLFKKDQDVLAFTKKLLENFDVSMDDEFNLENQSVNTNNDAAPQQNSNDDTTISNANDLPPDQQQGYIPSSSQNNSNYGTSVSYASSLPHDELDRFLGSVMQKYPNDDTSVSNIANVGTMNERKNSRSILKKHSTLKKDMHLRIIYDESGNNEKFKNMVIVYSKNKTVTQEKLRKALNYQRETKQGVKNLNFLIPKIIKNEKLFPSINEKLLSSIPEFNYKGLENCSCRVIFQEDQDVLALAQNLLKEFEVPIDDPSSYLENLNKNNNTAKEQQALENVVNNSNETNVLCRNNENRNETYIENGEIDNLYGSIIANNTNLPEDAIVNNDNAAFMYQSENNVLFILPHEPYLKQLLVDAFNHKTGFYELFELEDWEDTLVIKAKMPSVSPDIPITFTQLFPVRIDTPVVYSEPLFEPTQSDLIAASIFTDNTDQSTSSNVNNDNNKRSNPFEEEDTNNKRQQTMDPNK